MIAVDSNVLVYAHREDSPWHDAAYTRILQLAEGRAPWAIPWPCIHEFLAIVTHARIYAPPTPLETAADQVEAWMESPSLILLSESENYWKQLRGIVQAARVSGPQIHDARVAALCRQHAVDELWTADRDFGRFPGLKVRNPLVT
ncbi:MAG: type II toxin-antitoxin system VapC family toxin [Nitrospiraceae bacterium]